MRIKMINEFIKNSFKDIWESENRWKIKDNIMDTLVMILLSPFIYFYFLIIYLFDDIGYVLGFLDPLKIGISDQEKSNDEVYDELYIHPELGFPYSCETEAFGSVCIPYETNVKKLDKLAKVPNYWMRKLVAYHKETGKETLKELAQDSNAEVRWAVARNSSIDNEIMNILLKDTNWEVRRGLAYNPNTNSYILSELAKDKCEYVRLMVIYNHNTSVETLKKLAKGRYMYIRKFARKQLKTV